MSLEKAEINAIISEISTLRKPHQQVYLVGGAIRDILLQRPIHDLDFVVNHNPIELARSLADRLAGDYFILDHDRQTARVIYILADKKSATIDFALLRGTTLEEDLRGRDFTLNAIAMNIENTSAYLDPLHGGMDIKQKTIKVCSNSAFCDDPLRILRLVRIALETGFRVDNETIQLAKSALDRLPLVSNERIRDEFFKMMETDKPDLAMRLLEHLGVLRLLMPFLVADSQTSSSNNERLKHAESVLSAANKLTAVLVGELPGELTGNLVLGQASLSLGLYRYRLQEFYAKQINPLRSQRSLFFLAVFVAGLKNYLPEGSEPKEKKARLQSGVSQFINNLALSQDEVRYLELTTSGLPLFTALLDIDGDLTRRERYCFFSRTGETGIDVILLSLANILGEQSFSLDDAFWRHSLYVSRQLMFSWWEEQDLVIDPQRLVDGDELITRLGISPGPLVGTLLRELREEQAAGMVNTKEDAWVFLEARRSGLIAKEG